ncbi:glycosyltransferase [Gammaproteobacteria bacterium]|nr:glycosyltransferase [Gammaproteobacteria bacterium]
MHIHLVIPCFNESGNLLELHKKLCQLHLKYSKNFSKISVTLVNNGSSDRTSEILDLFQEQWLSVLHLDSNLGYGGGIYHGIASKKDADIIGYTHADHQTHPQDFFEAALKIQDENISFVKGKRYGRPIIDRFFTFGMSLISSFVLRGVYYDINAQPTVFPSSFLNQIVEPPTDFSFDLFLYFLAKKRGIKIYRINVHFGPRFSGVSSWNKGIKDRYIFIKRTLKFIWQLSKRNVNSKA